MRNLRKFIVATAIWLPLLAGAAPATTEPTTRPVINAMLNDPMFPKYSTDVERKRAAALKHVFEESIKAHRTEWLIESQHRVENMQRRVHDIQIVCVAGAIGLSMLFGLRQKRKQS